jgi:hypothetical protein
MSYLNMNGNQVIMVVAVICLGVVAVVIPDKDIKLIAVTAIAGLVAGHLNGSQSAKVAKR